VAKTARDDALSPDLFALVQKHVDAAERSVRQKSSPVERGSGAGALVALAPRHGCSLEVRPTFEWTPIQSATSYRVTLYDAKERKIWQQSTSEIRVPYPEAGKPLAPGDYRWDVIAEPVSLRQGDSTPFFIPAAAQAEAIRGALRRASQQGKEGSITPLPYLAVCLEHRLYPQAEAILREAIQRTPTDGTLREMLMRVYQQTDRSAERERLRPLMIDAK
jgi:hypothetical protein